MNRLHPLARRLVETATAKGLMVATAESCTAGMVAAAITDIAGASAMFDRGFVTYSNAAKIEMLGVDGAIIERAGAVSAEAARAMAEGALLQSHADIAVSITGVAGPSGGSPEKPVGLVWFGLAAKGSEPRVERRVFSGGGRDYVRLRAAETALLLALSAM